MGYMGFGLQKWIYTAKPRKVFQGKRILTGKKAEIIDVQNKNQQVDEKGSDPDDHYPTDALSYITRKNVFGRLNFRNKLLLLTLLAILIYVLYQVGSIFTNRSVHSNLYQQKLEAFRLTIDYANEYLTNGGYTQAIAEFRQARKLFPDKYEAIIGLSEAFTFSCRHSQKNCDSALRYLDMLIASFPENKIYVFKKTELMSKIDSNTIKS